MFSTVRVRFRRLVRLSIPEEVMLSDKEWLTVIYFMQSFSVTLICYAKWLSVAILFHCMVVHYLYSLLSFDRNAYLGGLVYNSYSPGTLHISTCLVDWRRASLH